MEATHQPLCTENTCVEIRKYIFVSGAGLYCSNCIVSKSRHLFEHISDSNSSSIKCSKCSSLATHKIRTVRPLQNGEKKLKPIGCNKCIHEFQPSFKITKNYVESTKLNKKRLCTFLIGDPARPCYNEACHKIGDLRLCKIHGLNKQGKN